MKKTRQPTIAVSDARGVRSLHVGGEAIQSSMKLADPFALALDYTRCMMAFLLFHPKPREVLMIGLGGGSLAKFFYRRLRDVRVRVVEIDPRVVATARQHFALPPDDERLTIEIGDGAESLEPECCDVLMIDAYHDEAHVPKLATAHFYDAAYLALRAPGALVVNFMDDDPLFDEYLKRLERAFAGAVIILRALYDPNVIAFAFKGLASRRPWDDLKRRAAQLEAKLGLPFGKYAKRLRASNRFNGREFFISP